jgi:hypothetical protein
MCTRTAGGIQRRGEELSPQTLLDNSVQWDADYLNKKNKSYGNHKHGKVENETVDVNSKFLRNEKMCIST